MKNKLLILLTVISITACSPEVNLCDRTLHPHQTNVHFKYNFSKWGEQEKQTLMSDSMYVFATRVIRNKNTVLAVMPSETEHSTGHYVLNAPELKDYEDYWFDRKEPDTHYPLENLYIPSKLWDFLLPSGEYRFITISKSSGMLDFDMHRQLIAEDGTENNITDLSVKYHGVPADSEELDLPTINGKPDKGWDDLNAYSECIKLSNTPIAYEMSPLTKLGENDEEVITFTPERISQHIDINFKLVKKPSGVPFTIENVFCDLSGIPNGIFAATGYLDISKTLKVRYTPELLNSNGSEIKDTPENDVVICHKTIDVFSLVSNESRTGTTGPGILQVVIYTRDADGSNTLRRLQGKINIFDALQKAELIKLSSDGNYIMRNCESAILDITPNLQLDGKSISEIGTSIDGNTWIECTEDVIVEDNF